ncbi:MAG: tRNA uridine-5-carboxymethylaminomethyl(34) synthesis GTPase MnmE [Betaproteobacteria bacterium]
MPRDEVARDTIAAVATPAGRGGIGIVRVSGPAVPAIARRVAGKLPRERHAAPARFRAADGAPIDEGLVLYFAAPRSYTGEEVLELHGHGGLAVMRSLLGACLDAGARLAEPGEFTRRAYLEGKLDLAQAEAVADLIDAASAQAARAALRSLSGEFSSQVEALRAGLVELRALIDAMLDFRAEEVDTLHRDAAAARLAALRESLARLREQSRQGRLLREGLHVVLVGPPNVGKSSLLNRLVGEERAIVTPVPGTTRDALREPVELEGVPLVVVDTAGLRETEDPVERLGVERSRREIEAADLVLAVVDAAAGGQPVPAAEARASLAVYNKLDLVPGFAVPAGAIGVSAKTGAGIERLREAMLREAGWVSGGEAPFIARERHLRALDDTARHLERAAREPARAELFAEELRLAHRALGEITGEFSADDLLGEIFARFCIGK